MTESGKLMGTTGVLAVEQHRHLSRSEATELALSQNLTVGITRRRTAIVAVRATELFELMPDMPNGYRWLRMQQLSDGREATSPSS